MMMQMLGAFAEYEREMVKERTQAGLKAARMQGRHGGRRPKFTQAQRAEILSMLAAGRPAAEVARLQSHQIFMLRSKTWPKIDRPCTQASFSAAKVGPKSA